MFALVACYELLHPPSTIPINTAQVIGWHVVRCAVRVMMYYVVRLSTGQSNVLVYRHHLGVSTPFVVVIPCVATQPSNVIEFSLPTDVLRCIWMDKWVYIIYYIGKQHMHHCIHYITTHMSMNTYKSNHIQTSANFFLFPRLSQITHNMLKLSTDAGLQVKK